MNIRVRNIYRYIKVIDNIHNNNDNNSLVLNEKWELEELGKKKRKVLRKMVGRKQNGNELRKRNNKELYLKIFQIT